ncbi:hypothetical protein GCM10023193_11110 [Planotetraspora kaengkrachanensis]|uniref:NAD-dependent epimerase/dehydratase domain-containing protein n=1 Tax=Planotetraspora kaengkrachanensis TaxID=575193 RepID=A0A8J3LVU1_9ACTN|nr:hypothetical protein Pka01_05700 [Planotetraspora kaengkrachanensis]
MVAVFCGKVLRGERPVIYGDGTQTRDYVHVADVAAAFLAAADLPQAGVWNIGTGVETGILTLAEVIGRRRAGASRRSSPPPGPGSGGGGGPPPPPTSDR